MLTYNPTWTSKKILTGLLLPSGIPTLMKHHLSSPNSDKQQDSTPSPPHPTLPTHRGSSCRCIPLSSSTTQPTTPPPTSPNLPPPLRMIVSGTAGTVYDFSCNIRLWLQLQLVWLPSTLMATPSTPFSTCQPEESSRTSRERDSPNSSKFSQR